MTATIRTRDGYEVRLRLADDGSVGVVVAHPNGGCSATFRPTESAALAEAEKIIGARRALTAERGL